MPNSGNFSLVWNFSKVKSTNSEVMSFGGIPTNFDYFISGGKEEEVVDAAFQHRRCASHPEYSLIQSYFIMHTCHSILSMSFLCLELKQPQMFRPFVILESRFDNHNMHDISLLFRYAPEAETDASLVMATQHALYNLGGVN